MDRDYFSKRVIRRIFGLPAKSPGPVPLRMEGNKLIFLEGEEKQAEIDAWANEGWRGEISERIIDWIRWRRIQARAKNFLVSIKNRHQSREAYRSLAKTKTLEFSSPYVHGPDDRWEIEGWLTTDSGRSISLSIIAVNGLAKSVNKHYKKPLIQKAYSSDTSVVFGASRHWILAPGQSLDEKKIAAVIQDWYHDRYRFDRNNQIQSGEYPEITVKVSWDDSE